MIVILFVCLFFLSCLFCLELVVTVEFFFDCLNLVCKYNIYFVLFSSYLFKFKLGIITYTYTYTSR